MAEPLFMLRTLLPVALSQTAKIMVASSEQLSPDVLSTNAGSYYITVSSTTFYFEKKKKRVSQGKASGDNKVKVFSY